MKYILILFLFYIHNCNTQEAKIKTWISNTNYDEPKNWLGHKLPCEGSKIIFPEDLNAAIYLPPTIKVKEIDLFNDGELIMKPDGYLEVTGEDDYECERKEVTFKKINIEPWFKPSNWKSNKKENPAIPHLERVPCIYDDVVFPNKSSFWVQYPEVSISVNSFTIEGESLSNERLQTFLLSEPGDRQFRNFDFQYRTDVINVEELKCIDKTGCLCHRSDFIEKAVCKNLQQVCNLTHCLNPVKPIGHCCEFCGFVENVKIIYTRILGAYLRLKFHKNNFNLYEFNKIVQGQLSVYGYTDIYTHISKVLYKYDTYIQVVIMEKDFKYKGDSVSAAQELHNIFVSNLEQYKLLQSELFVAGAEYWPGQQLKRTTAIVLGSLFLVLLTLIIIYMRYETEKGKKFNLPNIGNFKPFIFVRFENVGDDTGLEFRNRSVASSLFNLDRAFDNPLYDEPSASTSQKEEEHVPDKIQSEFNNPLFSELKQKEVSDEE